MSKESMPKLDDLGAPGGGADDPPVAEQPRRRGRRKADPAGESSPPSSGSADKAPRKPRQPRGSKIAGEVSGKIRSLLSTIGAVAAATGQDVPAQLLIGDQPAAVFSAGKDPAQAFSDAWGRVAAENPRFRKMIDGLNAGGVYGEAILATMTLALPIAAAYGLLPPRISRLLFPEIPDPNAEPMMSGVVAADAAMRTGEPN